MRRAHPAQDVMGQKNNKQVGRYREREKQVQLAKKRGEVHIGDDANHTQQKT